MAERMCPAACDGCCDCNEFPRYHHAHDCRVPTLDELQAAHPRDLTCKWCDRLTDNRSRKCDECLREIETDRRIDAARGK